MNKNNELLKVLYLLLTDELIDINHYMTPLGMYENRDSGKLHLAVRKKAIDKMRNAEWLIRRIIYYEGSPKGFDLDASRICEVLSQMISDIKDDELYVEGEYRDVFKRTGEIDDLDAAEILDRIFCMTKGKEDWSGFSLVN
jgi:bacterioferritin (cytochrome b1)